MTSSDDKPRVTVVMGVYNCADTLDEALDSLVNQTYSNWDLVVCDDASIDATYQKLLDWQQRLPGQLTVLRNEVNAKLAYSLNRCLEQATGDLIARMDGDDLSMPDRFTRQVAYLQSHPEAVLVGTAMQRFSAAGLADVLPIPEQPDVSSLRSGSPFCHATIMCRRTVFETLKGYVDLPRTQRVEDLDLWFRFYAQGFVGHNLSEPLYLVREDLAAIRRRTAAQPPERLSDDYLGVLDAWVPPSLVHIPGNSTDEGARPSAWNRALP